MAAFESCDPELHERGNSWQIYGTLLKYFQTTAAQGGRERGGRASFSHSSEKHSPPFYCDRPPTGDTRHDRGLLFSPGLMMSCSHRQRQDEKKQMHMWHIKWEGSVNPSFRYGEVFSLPKSLPSLSYLYAAAMLMCGMYSKRGVSPMSLSQRHRSIDRRSKSARPKGAVFLGEISFFRNPIPTPTMT